MALALWTVVTTVNIIRSGWNAVPVVDDWDRWLTYLNRKSIAGWLFAQHYDHRLAAPKLLFMLDAWAFHARGWFLLACSFLFQTLTLVLLWRLAGSSYPQSRRDRLVQAAVLATWMFSGQQWINIVLPFQVQFTMVYAAALSMLYVIWRSAENNWRTSWMVLGILLGLIATYSMANGILIFPIALLAGVSMRMPRRWIVVLSASSVFISCTYFYSWKRFRPPQMTLIERLHRGVIFGLNHLGAPATLLPHALTNAISRAVFVEFPGGALAIGLIVTLMLLWRRRAHYNHAFGTLVFYGLFLLGATVTMAYGRSNGPLLEAYEPRYMTPAYILWGCMLLIAWPLLRRISGAALYTALCALLLEGVATNQPHVLMWVNWWADLIRLGETAIVDNVADPLPWGKLDTRPEMTELFYQIPIQYLRHQHLSLFAAEWTRWPGIPLRTRFSIDPTPGACEGIFSEIVSIAALPRPGWRVSGWARDTKVGRAPGYVILADTQGVVAGVALTRFLPPPELAVYSPRYKDSTWRGYVSGPVRQITAYALETDGRSLCAIDSQIMPGGLEHDLSHLGVVLPKVAPLISSGWVLDGYPKGEGGPGTPASGGPVYGSFPGNGGGGTRSIQIGTFRLGWNASIAIPFVTGPDSYDASILVRDGDSKEIFARLDPVPVTTTWCAWHPNLPSDGELNLEIVAEAKVSDSGRWLAIAWPHLSHRVQ
jgi:hypothetical protein